MDSVVARLVGRGSRYLLLPIFPALESYIFGETEAQWHENVLDPTQESRAEAEVLSFAYDKTSVGESLPFSSLELLHLSSEEPEYDGHVPSSSEFIRL